VSDRPLHFDLMRVDEHAPVKIAIPVHFKNAEDAPFNRQGGSLEVVRHDVEILVKADSIPEELVVDLANAQMGDTIRISDVQLPKGAQPTIGDRDFVIATIKVSSAALSAAADEAAEGSTEEASEG
jgi:large subunit ribosomal protein L25